MAKTSGSGKHCRRCQLDSSNRLDHCSSLVWTQHQLRAIRRSAQAEGSDIPDRIWRALMCVDRTLFCIRGSRGLHTSYPPLQTLNDEESLNRQLHFDVMLLMGMDLQPGHSVLVIQESPFMGLGYISHMVAHLIAPGGSNIGLCGERISNLCCTVSSILYRLNPRRQQRTVPPFFTSNVADALGSGRTYDRIVVYDVSLTSGQFFVLQHRLKPGGRLISCVDRHYSKLFVQVDRADQNVFEEVESPFYHPFILYSNLLSTWQLDLTTVDLDSPSCRAPLPLAVQALRVLSRGVDPIARHRRPAQPRLQGIYKCAGLEHDDRFRRLRDVERAFKTLVDGASSDTISDFHTATRVKFADEIANVIPIEVTGEEEEEEEPDNEVKPLLGFNDVCKRLIKFMQTRQHLCNCPLPQGRGMCVPATIALDAVRSKRRFLNDILWRGPSVQVQNQQEIVAHQHRLLEAIRRRHFPADHLPASEHPTMVQELAMAAARLVSDARALQRLLSSPVAQLLAADDSAISMLRQELGELLQEVEKEVTDCRLAHRWATYGEIMDFFIFMLPSKVPVSLVLTLRTLARSINANFKVMAQVPQHTNPDCDRTKCEIDAGLFFRHLSALDGHTPRVFSGLPDLLDFLAARVVHDGADLVAYTRREREDVRVCRLSQNPHLFVRQVLHFLPVHIQNRLLSRIDVNRVFE